MKLSTTLVLTFCGLTAVAGARVAEEAPPGAQARIGEVRTLAIAPENQSVASELHRDGWLEARGQMLAVGEFPELYKVVGRAWTAGGVARIALRFRRSAIDHNGVSVGQPVWRARPRRSRDGRANSKRRPSLPLTWWIFVGRPVTAVSVSGVVGR